jgi:hypothetical protein
VLQRSSLLSKREYGSCVAVCAHIVSHYSAWIVGNAKLDSFLRLLRFLRSDVKWLCWCIAGGERDREMVLTQGWL